MPFAFALLAAIATGQEGPPPAPVHVDAAVSESLQEMRRVSGEVRAADRSLVATREAGLVLEVLVREGDRVEKGAPLARLDRTMLERDRGVLSAQEGLAKAQIAEREASREQAERDHAALLALAGRDAVSPKELADAKTTLAAARARLQQGQEELRVLAARRAQLEQRLSDTVPTAPFTGTVVSRRAEAGAWVGVGGGIVELVSSDRLEAWIDVPQAWYGSLRRSSDPLRIEIDGAGDAAAGNAIGGVVHLDAWRVLADVNPEGRTFPLIAPLPADLAITSGMSLTAIVPTGVKALYTTVSRDAILRGETGPYLYVARPTAPGAPASALFLPVEVLFPSDDRVAVRAPGLTPGDLVVVEGNERLFPSAPLLLVGDERGGDAR
jgi:RND family efflux transporter MFP subunit